MFKQRGDAIPMLALATAGCLWGTGFYFGKLAERPRFERKEWNWVFTASALGVPVQYLMQFKGLSLTTVSNASLMVGTLPILLAIAAVLFAGEQLHFGGWLALASSTFGAALIALSSREASDGSHPSMRGDLLVVLSMFAAIGWILISKRLMRRHSPVMVTAIIFWTGTALLAVVVVTTSGVPSLHYSAREDCRGSRDCIHVSREVEIVGAADTFSSVTPLLGPGLYGVTVFIRAVGRNRSK